MQSSKPIRHPSYDAAAAPRISWNSAAQGIALVAAFLFVSAFVCGIL
jgi:hypothetical protein